MWPDPPLRPTCSTKARGQTLKPRSAAGKRGSVTAASSALGLSTASDSVREAPRRTSPKQRNGFVQKWFRDRTGGDAASALAAGPRSLAGGLRSAGLSSPQPSPTRRVAMAARAPQAAPEGDPEDAHRFPQGRLRRSRERTHLAFSSSRPHTEKKQTIPTNSQTRQGIQHRCGLCLGLNFPPPPMGTRGTAHLRTEPIRKQKGESGSSSTEPMRRQRFI